MKKEENYVKICPKCGNTDIGFRGGRAQVWDHCRKCGFSMANFPEIEESQIEEFKKELKKI